MTISTNLLPIPDFFTPTRVDQIWRVPYQERAKQAQDWAKLHGIEAAAKDTTRVGLLLIDVQNTFCIPEFELFVGGRSGRGAVADNIRLCEFIYRHLSVITEIIPTLDTHTAMQIFHPQFWVNNAGENPPPMTMISLRDVQQGVWKVNPGVAYSLTQGNYGELAAFALHYVQRLSEEGKYPLTIWPYHSMLGGIGHALVASVEEACFFHAIARHSQTRFEIKGSNPLTENYSVLRPEVLDDARGRTIASKNTSLMPQLLQFDVIIIAGQAKSHCVAWTVGDLLTEIQALDPQLAKKVYLLEDCTSPVVVPGVVDFTEQANGTFQGFADAGMHLVKSINSMASWIS